MFWAAQLFDTMNVMHLHPVHPTPHPHQLTVNFLSGKRQLGLQLGLKISGCHGPNPSPILWQRAILRYSTEHHSNPAHSSMDNFCCKSFMYFKNTDETSLTYMVPLHLKNIDWFCILVSFQSLFCDYLNFTCGFLFVNFWEVFIRYVINIQ